MSVIDPHDVQRLMEKSTKVVDTLESIADSLESIASQAKLEKYALMVKLGIVCSSCVRSKFIKTDDYRCRLYPGCPGPEVLD